MIGSIRGILLEYIGGAALIETAGVGYVIHTSSEAAAAIIEKEGQEVFLYTHLAVREDAQDLYGFTTREELDFFKLLITISGIGPKSALGILSVAPVQTLRSAVAAGDTSYLTKVSGIGAKTAKKIVLELQDRLEGEEINATYGEDADVIEALVALGYSQDQARKSLKNIDISATSTQDRLREALKVLNS